MTRHLQGITQAQNLAALALRLSNPNPRVGCVITAPDGRVIGQGHTQQAGGPHAEIMALRDAQAGIEGAIIGRALYDGRIDPGAALAAAG